MSDTNLLQVKTSSDEAARRDLSAYKVLYAEKGLLRVDMMPKHLEEAVKHNANSPLLRLPGELRNKIWEYAMTMDAEVQVNCHPVSRKFYVVNCGKMSDFERGSKVQTITPFHLPEICCQTYIETATLGYAFNAFGFTSYYILCMLFMQKWSATLKEAQRDAVTRVKITLRAANGYLNNPGFAYKQVFPGLERISVAKIPHYDVKLQENIVYRFRKQVEAHEGAGLSIALC